MKYAIAKKILILLLMLILLFENNKFHFQIFDPTLLVHT